MNDSPPVPPEGDDAVVPAADVVAVIPALDAAGTIAPVITGALRHVRRVVVVDDGSSDATGARAAEAGAEVLRHEANQGKGAALRTAFQRLLAERRTRGPAGAAIEAVLTLDADGQHDPADIPLFLALWRARRPALVVGSRARHFAAMWGPRRAMNLLSSAAMRILAGARVPDSQSGFRLYDAPFLERLRIEGTGYEAEAEAILQAAALRLPIASVEIHLGFVDGRPTSHYRPLADTLRIAGTVLRHWGRGLAGRRDRSRSGPPRPR